ncbi:hypothetical protein [Nocardioides sp.]|uniref:hypothetical protein n=1 Tax=Nocardioides sp. TaxID=35761 RepID=UPI003515DE61
MTSFRRPRARSSALALVLAAGSLAAVVAAPTSPAQAAGTTSPITGETIGETTTFSTAGEFTYTIPATAYALEVTLIGGAGTGPTATRGKGAKLVTVVPTVGLDPTLYVRVAANPAGLSPRRGGQASSIQTCSGSSESCVLTAGEDDPRLAVAGGGGGHGAFGNNTATVGGDAGVSTISGPGKGGKAGEGRDGGLGALGETPGQDGDMIPTQTPRARPGFGAPSTSEINGGGGDGWTGGGMGSSKPDSATGAAGGGAGSSYSIGNFSTLETSAEAPMVSIAPVYRGTYMRLDATPQRFVSGQATTFSTQITVNAGDGVPLPANTGTVDFTQGTRVLCADVPVGAGGAASCRAVLFRTDYIKYGQEFKADYTPSEGAYVTGTYNTVNVIIDAGATTNTLKYANKKLTATVKAKAPATGTPAGTVDFKVNGKKFKSVPLKNGVAVLAYTTKKKVSITAAFIPSDINFTGSDSAAVTVKP